MVRQLNRRAILFLFVSLAAALFLGIPYSYAAGSTAITLEVGEKLKIRSDHCNLSVPKNVPVKIKVKCATDGSAYVIEASTPNAGIILSAGESQIIKGNQCALTVIKNTTDVIKVKCKIAEVPICWAQNNTYGTTCAEEDNINVPIYGSEVKQFRVTATHPTYAFGADNCSADFSGCSQFRSHLPRLNDDCDKLFDDGVNVVEGCSVVNWWRGRAMSILVGNQQGSYHYLTYSRKIDAANEWPRFFVLYQDGYMRLIPHPPMGRTSVCFGSSVIVGPAVKVSSNRPYSDIQEIEVFPGSTSLAVTYINGSSSFVTLSVNRIQATADIQVNYAANGAAPFAVFRSMYVGEGNADVDHLQSGAGDVPIESDWANLIGKWWFFHRDTPSIHNTSGPDIRIEVVH